MIKIFNSENNGKDLYSSIYDSMKWVETRLRDNRNFVPRNRMEEIWEIGIFRVLDSIELPDFFDCGGMVIVSRRLMNLVKSFQQDGIEFLPIQITRDSTGEVLDYHYMNVFKTVDCIDFDKSDCTISITPSGSRRIALVRKIILKPIELSGINIFSTQGFPYLCVSDSFAKVLINSGFTGFYFGTLSDPYGYNTYCRETRGFTKIWL